MSAVVSAEEAAHPASGAAGGAALANEGRAKKLVRDVEQASFWGSAASKFGRRVLRVTERAVFTLDGERLTQREVAPGVGLRPDALDQIEFTPEIDDDLKETGPGACAETRGGLVSVMDEKAA